MTQYLQQVALQVEHFAGLCFAGQPADAAAGGPLPLKHCCQLIRVQPKGLHMAEVRQVLSAPHAVLHAHRYVFHVSPGLCLYHTLQHPGPICYIIQTLPSLLITMPLVSHPSLCKSYRLSCRHPSCFGASHMRVRCTCKASICTTALVEGVRLTS